MTTNSDVNADTTASRTPDRAAGPSADGAGEAGGGSGLGAAVHDGLVLTKRSLLRIPRVPEILVFATIQPVMFVLLFAYVFGSAIPLPGGGSYREYLIPGIFVQTLAFSTGATAVGLAEDMSKGLVDRFRSLPIARSAVLSGRTLADLLLNVFVLVIMVVAGLVVGWRVRSSIGEVALAVVLLLLFTFSMTWIGALVGLSVRSPEVANTAGFVWLFPLTFLSNAFVPLQGLPHWLRIVAEWNPVSTLVAACRDLFGNPNPISNPGTLPGDHPVALSFGYVALILAVFVPLSVHRYRTATSR